ncbi:MAG TPA: hypothetical protein VKV96_05370, partial [Roseiarcus sp.]|nr:hypothetical protein [Roseiarcus sp.]
MRLTRRTLLGGGLSAAVWAALRGPSEANAPAQDSDGFRVVEAGPASAESLGASARALGYGGATPGPLLRAKLGETLKVRLVNRLSEP